MQLALDRPWLSPTERASVSTISLRHILASPGYAPGTIAVNVTWMERGFNAGQKHKHIPIYLQPFTSYSEILVGNCNFSLPLPFNDPVGVFPTSHWNSGKKSLVLIKLESWGYSLPGSEDSLTIG